MRQDFWDGSEEADGDDLDRLFSRMAENDPPPGRAFDETLANLRQWQTDPPPHRRQPAWLATLVVLVLLMGGLVWLNIGPHSNPLPTVADNSVLDVSGPTTVVAGGLTLGPTQAVASSVSPTVRPSRPTVSVSVDPALARLIRLNEHEKANLVITSDDDNFMNAFKSRATPSPI